MWGTMVKTHLNPNEGSPFLATHGNCGRDRRSGGRRTAQVWMHQFLELFGERLPHTKKTCIAAFKTIKAVYEQMVAELQNRPRKRDLCNYKTFCRMILAEFNDLAIGSVRCPA